MRWKPIHQQPIGWEPDINDGVRLNIRPFMADDLPGGKKGAGILRAKPNIHWRKDRGKEPFRDQERFPWFWNARRIHRRPRQRRASGGRPQAARRATLGSMTMEGFVEQIRSAATQRVSFLGCKPDVRTRRTT